LGSIFPDDDLLVLLCAGAFVFLDPDALRAVVVVLALDAGFAAAVALDAAGFFSKKSVMEDWAVGFVFLAGFMYALLSSSSLSALVGGEQFTMLSR
jgi:hypothetical protein